MLLQSPLSSKYQPIPNNQKLVVQAFLYRLHVACSVMKASTEARFSCLVFFQRYSCHYFSNNSENEKSIIVNEALDDCCQHLAKIATACLFLACKSEEDYQTLRNVINVSSKLGFFTMEYSTLSRNIYIIKESHEPPPLDDSYWLMKKSIIEKEQELLRMLEFDVIVPQPHRCLLILVRYISMDSNTSRSSVVKNAWKRLNNVVLSEGTLRHACLNLAAAALWLAINDVSKDLNKFRYKVKLINHIGYVESVEEKNSKDTWWNCLGVDNNELYKVIGDITEVTKRLNAIKETT